MIANKPHWPQLLFLIALCALVELSYCLIGDRFPKFSSQRLDWESYFLLAFAFSLPIVLSFGEQRIGRAILESGAAGASMSITLMIHISISNNRLDLVDTIAGPIAGAGLLIVLRLVAHFAVRALGWRVIVQTGHLCWTCSYDLTGNESDICPECGMPVRSDLPTVR